MKWHIHLFGKVTMDMDIGRMPTRRPPPGGPDSAVAYLVSN
jgi:hypothetical protein